MKTLLTIALRHFVTKDEQAKHDCYHGRNTPMGKIKALRHLITKDEQAKHDCYHGRNTPMGKIKALRHLITKGEQGKHDCYHGRNTPMGKIKALRHFVTKDEQGKHDCYHGRNTPMGKIKALRHFVTKDEQAKHDCYHGTNTPIGKIKALRHLITMGQQAKHDCYHGRNTPMGKIKALRHLITKGEQGKHDCYHGTNTPMGKIKALRHLITMDKSAFSNHCFRVFIPMAIIFTLFMPTYVIAQNMCNSATELGQCADGVDNNGDGIIDNEDTMICIPPTVNNATCSIQTAARDGDFNNLNVLITADTENADSCSVVPNSIIFTSDNGDIESIESFTSMFTNDRFYSIRFNINTDIELPITVSGEYTCNGQGGITSRSIPANCRPFTLCNNDNRCTVFVTSDDFQGNFGGISGADDICQNRADDAGLVGTYLSWLSSSASNSPSQRFNQRPIPYQLTNRIRIADNFNSLTSQDLINPINVDENGNTINSTFNSAVWTNTLRRGDILTGLDDTDCDNWALEPQNNATGSVGSYDETDFNWSYSGSLNPCTNEARLYCFEQ